MRVLHYIPSIDRASGGVGSYMQLLAKSLGLLVDLHIVTHRSGHPLPIENASVHYISHWHRPLRMRREWCALLNQLQPDVVHTNGCWLPGPALLQRWAQRKGYKVVLSPHGMLEPWVIRLHYWTRKLPALLLYQKAAVKHADCLHATAESERKNLLALGWNERVGIVTNGVDVAEIKTKQSWQRSHTLLYIGLLRPNKGAGILVEAAGLIKDQLAGHKIIIAGPDVEGCMAVWQKRCAELGIADIVSFVGPVYGEEKWKLYREADTFVLPTLNENFGIVIAEALASGTPVITCKGAPWPELLSERCGWWVERTPQDVANAILESLSLPTDSLEQMGRRGRRLVEERYSTEKMARDMVALYSSLAAETSA